tara:strand:+ start:1757 stop:2053 length:297 start_codon:yes stop_codon:yes gene_type:complete
MILEVAHLQVISGRELEFESAFEKAQLIIAAMDGYISHDLQRCIEDASHYLLQVRWTTLEAHTVGFRSSAQYQQWRALLHHFYDPFPEVLHFEALRLP